MPTGDPNISPTLNRVVFNNGGEGYDLRTGRVLRLMIKAEGITAGPEQALFTAYFDFGTDLDGDGVITPPERDLDGNGFVDRDFREIRDETDFGNNSNP